ncbi:META domain-containing protein [Qipengyuania sp. YIM B01966]
MRERADGGRLVIGPVAATRMYCDGKMEAEQQFGRLLESDPRIPSTAQR